MLHERFNPGLRESHLASTFYLYPSLQAVDDDLPTASGIVVGFPLGDPATSLISYAVAPASIVKTGVAPVGRLNHRQHGVFPLATDTDLWHADAENDLAVCLFGVDYNAFEYRVVGLPQCADASFSQRFRLEPGHAAAVLGVLPSKVVPRRNTPQFIEAELRHPEKLELGRASVKLHSGEAPLPGAAAFVFTDEPQFARNLVGVDSPFWGPWLVGLCMPAKRSAKLPNLRLIPISRIHALLASTVLAKQRDKWVPPTKAGSRVTSVAAPPLHIGQPPLKKPRRRSKHNLHALVLYNMITSDFEGAWNAVARDPAPNLGRGSFMFGRQAMSLLEWISNVSLGESSGVALNSLSAALAYIDRRYFTVLPPECGITDKQIAQVPLPTAGNPKQELLAVIFDLARHGLAHQYQQVVATLDDGTDFTLRFTGAEYGRTIQALAAQRPERVLPNKIPTNTLHLTYTRDSAALLLTVSPAILYLDLKRAIELTGILSYMTDFPYHTRAGRYRFSSEALEQALRQGGHPRFTPPLADTSA